MLNRLMSVPETLGARIATALESLSLSLCDPQRRETTVAKLLVSYTLLWTFYDVVARGSQDLHFDMGEMVEWSRHLAIGHIKHPQMGAWIARLWFSVFPLQDWAFYLLANTMAALAIWVAWRISEAWLDDEKRAVGFAFLTLIPFFNFFSWKYNANLILLPLWAITTFWFFRSIETRNLPSAAFAGIAAAAAMMGKYWSIFLIAGLGLAALVHPARRAYFRSMTPWVTIIAGTIALSPHLYWLFANRFPSVEYAFRSHPALSLRQLVADLAYYVIGLPGYILLPLVLIVLLARPGIDAIRDTLLPESAERRFAAVAYWAPLLLPVPMALTLWVDMSALWAMPAQALMPVVFLSSPKLVVSRKMVARVLAVAMIFSFGSLLVAPARALRIHYGNATHFGAHYQLVAYAVEEEWRETTSAPLKIVGSYPNLVYGISFYFSGKPDMLNIEDRRETPWVSDADIETSGAAFVCPVNSVRCMVDLDRFVANHVIAKRAEKTLTRRYLGRPGKPKQFVIVIVLPVQESQRTEAPRAQ